MAHRRDDTEDEFMDLGEACVYTPDDGEDVPTQCMEELAQEIYSGDGLTVIAREDHIVFLRADIPEPLRNAIIVVTDAIDSTITRTYKIDEIVGSNNDTVTVNVKLTT